MLVLYLFSGQSEYGPRNSKQNVSRSCSPASNSFTTAYRGKTESYIYASFCSCEKTSLLPLWASTCLPSGSAAVAKFGLAPACHVETPKIELNKSFTPRASSPSGSLAESKYVMRVDVLPTHMRGLCM